MFYDAAGTVLPLARFPEDLSISSSRCTSSSKSIYCVQEINTAKWREVYSLGRSLPAASRSALMEDEVHFLVWARLENQREDRHRCGGITGRQFPREPGGRIDDGSHA